MSLIFRGWIVLSVSFEVLFQLFLLLYQSFGWFVVNIGE